MTLKKQIFIIISIVFLLSSCKKMDNKDIEYVVVEKSFSTASSLVDWTESTETGYQRTKTINGINFNLFYKPINYLKANQIVKNQNIFEYDSMILYFEFKIYQKAEKNQDFLSINLKDKNQYTDRMNHCIFSNGKDFSLTQDKMEFNPLIFHFERTYGLGNGGKFILGFDKSILDLNKEFTITYNDQLFSCGVINYYYDKSYLKTQPILKS
jgi:hypothetical protein